MIVKEQISLSGGLYAPGPGLLNADDLSMLLCDAEPNACLCIFVR